MNCCSKIPYPTAVLAGIAMQSIRRTSPVGKRVPEGIHPCPECRARHVRSKRGSARNKWTRELDAKMNAAYARKGGQSDALSPISSFVIVAKSGQTLPAKMFSSVTWLTEDLVAADRMLLSPIASVRFRTNWRAVSPTASSDGIVGHGDGASAEGLSRTFMAMTKA